jgi:hypothetical protein
VIHAQRPNADALPRGGGDLAVSPFKKGRSLRAGRRLKAAAPLQGFGSAGEIDVTAGLHHSSNGALHFKHVYYIGLKSKRKIIEEGGRAHDVERLF